MKSWSSTRTCSVVMSSVFSFASSKYSGTVCPWFEYHRGDMCFSLPGANMHIPSDCWQTVKVQALQASVLRPFPYLYSFHFFPDLFVLTYIILLGNWMRFGAICATLKTSDKEDHEMLVKYLIFQYITHLPYSAHQSSSFLPARHLTWGASWGLWVPWWLLSVQLRVPWWLLSVLLPSRAIPKIQRR